MMSMGKSRDRFLHSANEWLCDSYSVLIIYLALTDADGNTWLADASITASPFTFPENLDFHIQKTGIAVGHVVKNMQSKEEVLSIFKNAVDGIIQIRGVEYNLVGGDRFDFYSEMAQAERWFADLHLQVIGARPTSTIHIDFIDIDNQLRRSDPPFDGFDDVTAWLGLHTPRSTDRQPSIQLRVAPPVDLMFDRSSLNNNELRLFFRANRNFDIGQFGIAVRAVPGIGLQSRQQATNLIEWQIAELNSREGVAKIDLENCDNALVILMLGEQTVRRQWIVDSAKAGNIRLVATQLYDNELKRLSKMLFESTDSREFEKAVASLAFLIGLSPALQVETDAPDLLLSTPYGRIALIECTVKIADFTNKLGKLVERQQLMNARFEVLQHHVQIYGFLVCALPKERIRFDAAELESSGITLITQEHLKVAMQQLRHPPHPDKMFDDIDARFAVSASKMPT